MNDMIFLWHHYYYIARHVPALPGILLTNNCIYITVGVELKMWWFFRGRIPVPARPPHSRQGCLPRQQYCIWLHANDRGNWVRDAFPSRESRDCIIHIMLWSYSRPYVLYPTHTYVIDILYCNCINVSHVVYYTQHDIIYTGWFSKYMFTPFFFFNKSRLFKIWYLKFLNS